MEVDVHHVVGSCSRVLPADGLLRGPAPVLRLGLDSRLAAGLLGLLPVPQRGADLLLGVVVIKLPQVGDQRPARQSRKQRLIRSPDGAGSQTAETEAASATAAT